MATWLTTGVDFFFFPLHPLSFSLVAQASFRLKAILRHLPFPSAVMTGMNLQAQTMLI